MSLNQKYTWNDFLKENPELKERKVKRTSSEGKKAFEAAYKARIKEILKDRLVWIEKETARAGEVKNTLVANMKAAKKVPAKRKIQLKVGAKDKYIGRLGKMAGRTKQVQKNI